MVSFSTRIGIVRHETRPVVTCSETICNCPKTSYRATVAVKRGPAGQVSQNFNVSFPCSLIEAYILLFGLFLFARSCSGHFKNSQWPLYTLLYLPGTISRHGDPAHPRLVERTCKCHARLRYPSSVLGNLAPFSRVEKSPSMVEVEQAWRQSARIRSA